ncbi:MAG: ROK family protein [Pseudomonadota bacterium]
MHLLADIGGTNARFALADAAGTIRTRRVLPVQEFRSFEDALAAFAIGLPEKPHGAAFSVAGPVIDNAVDMTNTNWRISVEAVCSVLPAIPVRIVNDLAAVALAVPAMAPDDFEVLHAGDSASAKGPILCINLGTGFGAALSLPVGDGWQPLATEAGHMTLATCLEVERATLGDAVTVEEVFSGPGLQRLRVQAEAVGACVAQFRRVYSNSLGRLVGDLTLSTGAWGGVALCGGVLQDFDTVIDRSTFLSGICDRSGLATRLAKVPVRRITREDPALFGLLQVIS